MLNNTVTQAVARLSRLAESVPQDKAQAAQVNMAHLTVESVRGAHLAVVARLNTAIGTLNTALSDVSGGGLDAHLNTFGILQCQDTDIDTAVARFEAAKSFTLALDQLYAMTGVYKTAGLE